MWRPAKQDGVAVGDVQPGEAVFALVGVILFFYLFICQVRRRRSDGTV